MGASGVGKLLEVLDMMRSFTNPQPWVTQTCGQEGETWRAAVKPETAATAGEAARWQMCTEVFSLQPLRGATPELLQRRSEHQRLWFVTLLLKATPACGRETESDAEIRPSLAQCRGGQSSPLFSFLVPVNTFLHFVCLINPLGCSDQTLGSVRVLLDAACWHL